MHEVRSAVHELFYRKCCCIVASPRIKVLVNTRKCNCWESLPGVITCLPLGHSHSLPDRALLPDPTEKEERQVHINTGQEEKKERKGKKGISPPKLPNRQERETGSYTLIHHTCYLLILLRTCFINLINRQS